MASEIPTNPPTPATPQSHEDADDNTGHPQGEQLPTMTPEVHVPPPHPYYEVTCNKKRDGWDWAKMGAEFIGIIFLIVYTLYTAGIYCANQKAATAAHDTLGEIQKQTILQRQQLGGTLGAVIVIDRDEMPPRIIRGQNGVWEWGLGLKNIRPGTAHNVTAFIQVIKKRLPDQTMIEKPSEFTLNIGDVTTTPDRSRGIRENFPVMLSSNDISRIDNTQEAIYIDGHLSFDNGFEDKSIIQPFCFVWYSVTYKSKHGTTSGTSDSTNTCDEFRTVMPQTLAEKKARAEKD